VTHPIGFQLGRADHFNENIFLGLTPYLKGLSTESGLADKGIMRCRSLLKGEAPRFVIDFDNSLSSGRPFKFRRHLLQDLECDRLISTYCAYLW
jgi:hypothetical protein